MTKARNSSGKAGASNANVPQRGLSRRAVLKGGAAAGLAAATAPLGAPTIWAQEIKDIELRHVGVSYSVVKAIGDQASKDLGFKVTMQNLDTSAAINRFVTQPNTVDIADLEGWQAKLATKRGILQGIEVKRIKGKGRGVFARRPIRKGEVFETVPMIVLSAIFSPCD